MKNKKFTLCFATMCKNEGHVIGKVLESVSPYVDYIVVADTGSTDKTLDVVRDFLNKTKIPGEIFQDEWQGFDKNKTLMMQHAFGKADYVLHLDADDILCGDFDFNITEKLYDTYLLNVKRLSSTYKSIMIYDNTLHWRFVGAAHNLLKCSEKKHFTISDLSHKGYVLANPMGSRIFDPKKYLYDAEKLEKQFWKTLIDDPDELNHRSVFYTAQSYFDYGLVIQNNDYITKALQWYTLFTKLANTWNEENFESQMRVSRCLMYLKQNFDKIKNEMDKAISIFSDRAEPYFYFGEYCNQNQKHELAYEYLIKAKNISLESAKSKYILFVDNYRYGKYINDELSVACYWTGKYQEGLKYLLEIIDDPEFSHHKNRLEDNRQHFNKKMLELGIR
jgi:glycosyltransferase involved in cell wall biosynthesis